METQINRETKPGGPNIAMHPKLHIVLWKVTCRVLTQQGAGNIYLWYAYGIYKYNHTGMADVPYTYNM